MKNRLAVGTNQRDALSSDAKGLASRDRRFGEDFAQTKIQLAQVAGGNGVLFGDTKNFFSQRRLEFGGGVAEELRGERRRSDGNPGQRNVNAVSGGAGHQAKNEQRFVCHRLVGFKHSLAREHRRTARLADKE